MTRNEAKALLESDDLIAIGLRADQKRQSLHPDRIVSYCTEQPDLAMRICLRPTESLLEDLESAPQGGALTVWRRPELTAVEFLKCLAVCRLYSSANHIQIESETAGLKIGQLALRFGADDFGSLPGNVTEEQARRVIRDAGFIPKKRDRQYTVCYLE